MKSFILITFLFVVSNTIMAQSNNQQRDSLTTSNVVNTNQKEVCYNRTNQINNANRYYDSVNSYKLALANINRKED